MVVTDIRMPGANGFEVLRAVKARSPSTEVVMMNGYGTIADAVQAMSWRIRLHVFPVRLPAPRERVEDVPLLAAHFLEKRARAFRRDISELDPDALRILAGYSWPANVRELENAIERAVAVAKETIVLSGMNGGPGQRSSQSAAREESGAQALIPASDIL